MEKLDFSSVGSFRSLCNSDMLIRYLFIIYSLNEAGVRELLITISLLC